MQRVSDPGAACPKVKLAFSAPMLQNNGLFYFMRSATIDTPNAGDLAKVSGQP
jgi:hypothetical protein